MSDFELDALPDGPRKEFIPARRIDLEEIRNESVE